MALLQGTLDLLILRTLQFGPAHGHAIAKAIEQTSEDVLRVEEGTLYPALLKLEQAGWIASAWTESETGRQVKVYSLTASGRKQLRAEEAAWQHATGIVARFFTIQEDPS